MMKTLEDVKLESVGLEYVLLDEKGPGRVLSATKRRMQGMKFGRRAKTASFQHRKRMSLLRPPTKKKLETLAKRTIRTRFKLKLTKGKYGSLSLAQRVMIDQKVNKRLYQRTKTKAGKEKWVLKPKVNTWIRQLIPKKRIERKALRQKMLGSTTPGKKEKE